MTEKEKEQLTFEAFTLSGLVPSEEELQLFLEELEDPLFAEQTRQWLQAQKPEPASPESILSKFRYPDRIQALQPTIGFDLLFYWLLERDAIWQARRKGQPAPWTQDPIFRERKFTNICRDLDTESQTALRIAAHPLSQKSVRNFIARMMIFRAFNLTRTWHIFGEGLGEDPSADNLDPTRYVSFLPPSGYYSAAYNNSPPSPATLVKYQLPPTTKPAWFHLWVVQQMLSNGAVDEIANTKDLGQVYRILIKQPRISKFKGSQFAMDLNYAWLNHSIWDFCIAGEGAEHGVLKSFLNPQGYAPEYIIRLVTELQEECCQIARGQSAPRINGFPLYPMALQNAFCELNKFTRFACPALNARVKKAGVTMKAKYHIQPGERRDLPEPLLPRFYQSPTK
jgi:hypothetical protein